MHDETPDTPARAQTARELDRAIAERLGYRQNGDFWEYETTWDMTALVAELPHFRTDPAAMMKRIADEHLQVRINPQMDGSFFVWIDENLQEWSGHDATIPAAFWEAYFKYTAADTPAGARE